jgi:hypothetical protein
MKYLKRLVQLSNRVTKNKVYKYEDEMIQDDNGHLMRPSLKANGYWEFVDAPVQSKLKENDQILLVSKTFSNKHWTPGKVYTIHGITPDEKQAIVFDDRGNKRYILATWLKKDWELVNQVPDTPLSTTKETKMRDVNKIETNVTLINGKNAKSIDFHSLVDMLKSEKEIEKELQELGIEMPDSNNIRLLRELIKGRIDNNKLV